MGVRLKDLIRQGTEVISQMYPEKEAREMTLAYLCRALEVQRHTHIVEPDYEVTAGQAEEVLSAFGRMAVGEPMQYVLGRADFYGRTFRVTPSVLIPRPETELLCRMAVGMAESLMTRRRPAGAGDAVPLSVLDLCTGSGCIAWTMALELPGAEVAAVDISSDALEVAAGQDFAAEAMGSGAVVPEFRSGDVLSEGFEFFSSRRFDIVLSNPPYVMDKEKALMRPNVLEHEPHLALFVPDDDPLLFYRAVARHAALLLAGTGFGIVEINEALGDETAEVFRQAGFADVLVEDDLSGRPRFVVFRHHHL